MYRAIVIFLSSGCFFLNLVVIVVFSVCKVVMVECFVLNPDWCAGLCKLCIMRGKIIVSSVWPFCLFLLGLGINFLSFHI